MGVRFDQAHAREPADAGEDPRREGAPGADRGWRPAGSPRAPAGWRCAGRRACSRPLDAAAPKPPPPPPAAEARHRRRSAPSRGRGARAPPRRRRAPPFAAGAAGSAARERPAHVDPPLGAQPVDAVRGADGRRHRQRAVGAGETRPRRDAGAAATAPPSLPTRPPPMADDASNEPTRVSAPGVRRERGRSPAGQRRCPGADVPDTPPSFTTT